MISSPRLALAALCLAVAAPATAALSPAETRMVRTVDAEQARQLALLERLVNQNSGTLNSAGVKAVGDMMRAELEPLGFTVEWLDMAAANRSGHLVARKRGTGKKLLLIGHLDTVFELDSPFQKWTRKGGKGEGPGHVSSAFVAHDRVIEAHDLGTAEAGAEGCGFLICK